jgi:hypothetical protein
MRLEIRVVGILTEFVDVLEEVGAVCVQAVQARALIALWSR